MLKLSMNCFLYCRMLLTSANEFQALLCICYARLLCVALYMVAFASAVRQLDFASVFHSPELVVEFGGTKVVGEHVAV